MVKKYNIKKLVEANIHNHTTFREDSIVILIGTKGVIVVDIEGVHQIHSTIEDNYEIEVVKNPEPNTFAMMPDGILKASVKELMEAETEEVELGEYVRKFGNRLEQNYNILLKSIKEIGLDPTNYPRGK